MARTPEGKVKDWLDGQIKLAFPGAYTYKPPGGFFGVSGTPDIICLWKGVFIAIEVKAAGNVPTEIQWKRLKHIAAQGGVAAVMAGKDDRKMAAIIQAVHDKVKLHGTQSTV